MTTCRVVVQESQGLTLGLHLTEPWPMTVVAVVPRPLEEQVWVALQWQTDQPVPGHWQWQRGQPPARYLTLAALEAHAFQIPGG